MPTFREINTGQVVSADGDRARFFSAQARWQQIPDPAAEPGTPVVVEVELPSTTTGSSEPMVVEVELPEGTGVAPVAEPDQPEPIPAEPRSKAKPKSSKARGPVPE